MQKLALRRLMKKEREFLVNLSHGQGKRIISKASVTQLNLVSWILHYISIGAIPVNQETVTSLKKTRKRKLLDAHFATREAFKAFCGNQELQRTVLRHLSLQYSLLFRPILTK